MKQDEEFRRVSRPAPYRWHRPNPNHAAWCPKHTGAPGHCGCHRSATARSLRFLQDLAAGRARCPSMHEEITYSLDGAKLKRRTWRCVLNRPHPGQFHESKAGHRRWADREASAA